MKNPIFKTFCILLFFIISPYQILLAQEQAKFPRGVFTFGNTTVDFGQMKNDLHLNYVQGWSGYAGQDYPEILTNSDSLKVLAHRGLLSHYASSQRMEFQTERDAPLVENAWNYFHDKLTGTISLDDTSWQCIEGSHSAGFMVKSAVPDNEYHYDRSSYTATFVMKILKNKSGDSAVVTVSAYCKTHNHEKASYVVGYADFPDENYKPIQLSFELETQTCSPPCPLPKKALAGSLYSPLREEPHLVCKEIDIRVYWHGIVTTWLDKVIVEDDVAKNLFAEVHSDTIATEANTFKSSMDYPLVQRFYLQDEPLPSAFLAYNFVDQRLQAVQPEGLAQGRGRGITANYWHGSWLPRFIAETRPNEYLFDQYEMTVNIPSPSMTSGQASALGITPYTTEQWYTDTVQAAMNTLIDKFRSVRQNTAPTPFWYVPQLHGEYDLTQQKYIRARPPTGGEIKATMHLAIAYGAKGIIAYPYGTDIWKGWSYPGLVSNVASPDGRFRDHSDSVAVIEGKTVFTGYREKWDAFSQAMSKLALIETILPTLTWQAAKNWHHETTDGNWEGLIDTITTRNLNDVADTDHFVETGHFKLSGVDYMFVVNRRTLPSDSRWINIYFKTPPAGQQWRITDMSTGMGEGNLPPNPYIDVAFGPGEGRLYKIEVVPQPPAAPTLASPANGATNVSISPTLSWNASTSASTYSLQVATDVNFNSIVVNQQNIAGTSFGVSLDYNTTYYWHVKAVNAGGESGWSSTWSFTTEPRYFTLTINSPCGLPTNPSPGQHPFAEGTVVTVSVTSTVVPGGSGTQYVFTDWSGAVNSTNTSVSVMMDSDKEITANCKTQYELIVNSPCGLPTTGSGWYDAGQQPTACVTSTVASGGSGTQYVFTNWSGAASGTNTCVSITMDGRKEVTANCKTQYELIVNSPCGLPTNPSPGQYWYDEGTQVEVCVTSTIVSGGSGTQYVFTNWSGAASGTNTCVSITMNGPKEVTANCKTQYLLTVNTSPGGFGTSGQDWYDAGQPATACVNSTVIINGGTKYDLSGGGWSGDASGSGQCVNVMMNGPKSVTANYRVQVWVEMSMSGPCGSISPSSGWYNLAEGVEINAYASGNCVFLGWSGSGSGSTSSSYATAYIEPLEPISQHATFDYACIERSAPAWAYAFNEFEYVVPVYWPAPSGSCPLRFNIYRRPAGGNWELIAQNYGGLEFYDYPTPYTYGYNEYSYLIVTVSTTGQEIGGASATGGMYWW